MTYLVMECHPGYAVVLDSRGRFWKAANCGYAVGQTVERIVKLRRPQRVRPWKPLLAAAACLAVVVLASWQLLLTTYGTVRMEINPDVTLAVSRLGYVVGAEAGNADGAALLEGYRWRFRTAETAAGDLAARAAEQGSLPDDGTVVLTVSSEHRSWQQETEAALLAAVADRVAASVTVTTEPPADDAPEPPADDAAETAPEQTVVIPLTPPAEQTPELPTAQPQEPTMPVTPQEPTAPQEPTMPPPDDDGDDDDWAGGDGDDDDRDDDGWNDSDRDDDDGDDDWDDDDRDDDGDD